MACGSLSFPQKQTTLTLKCVTHFVLLALLAVCNVILTLECVTFQATVNFLRKNRINLSTFFRKRQRSLRSLFVTRYPYSRMCNVCNVCNVLTNKSKRYCTASSLRASLLACSDIAAVCCDSCIVRWQEILSPFDWPPWLLRSTAALKAILDKVSWRLILRTFSFSQLFLKNIDTFLKKLTQQRAKRALQALQTLHI